MTKKLHLLNGERSAPDSLELQATLHGAILECIRGVAKMRPITTAEILGVLELVKAAVLEHQQNTPETPGTLAPESQKDA